MGCTGSLVLARTEIPLGDFGLLAGVAVESVGHRADCWQLVAVDGHPQNIPGVVAGLVEVTRAPALIAVISDSDSALLLADSPAHHRWMTALNAPAHSAGPAAVADTNAMRAIAEVAVAWAAEAGHTATTDTVLEALCAADRDNRAADQAWNAAAGNIEAMNEIVRNQISFIEVHVFRVLAVLGLAVPVPDGSWWAQLASQVGPPSR